LVDTGYLRSRGCGQIDIAVLVKKRGEWFLRVIEAKTSFYASKGQVRRLLDSVDMVAKILNVPGGLEQHRAHDHLPKPG